MHRDDRSLTPVDGLKTRKPFINGTTNGPDEESIGKAKLSYLGGSKSKQIKVIVKPNRQIILYFDYFSDSRIIPLFSVVRLSQFNLSNTFTKCVTWSTFRLSSPLGDRKVVCVSLSRANLPSWRRVTRGSWFHPVGNKSLVCTPSSWKKNMF